MGGGLLLCLLSGISHAQVTTVVTPDPTLGTVMTETRSGSAANIDISGGTRPGDGQNLFHSFKDFSVAKDDTVNFRGPQSGLENILSRITGSQVSMIDGHLTSDVPGVNLYLLNPNGIVFGPNASLNIDGSFHISTADVIQLSDGGRFAADLMEQSNLTVATPSAFGFVGGDSAEITIQGSLSVLEGEALSVIGGDITLDSGRLEAPSGWVNLAAVASNRVVAFNGKRIGLSRLDGDITLMPGSEVTMNGPGGGVLIRGRSLSLDRAAIMTIVRGTEPGTGGNVDINVNELILTSGASIVSNTLGTPSGGFVIVRADVMTVTDNAFMRSDTLGRGKGGNVLVQVSKHLTVSEGAEISSSTFRTGTAGEVDLFSDGDITVDHGRLFVSAGPRSSGRAGIIRLNAQTLTLTGAAQVAAEAQNSGLAGQVTIRAENMIVMGQSTISSSMTLTGSAQDPVVTPGGQSAGAVTIEAKDMTVADQSISSSSITVNTEQSSTVEAGTISLRVNALTLEDGAQITAEALGDGNGAGGRVEIVATETVALRGDGTGIFTTAEGGATRSGDIDVSSRNVSLTDLARIDNSTQGMANGGRVTIAALETLTMADDASVRSNVVNGQGDGVTISTDMFQLAGRASINSLTLGSGSGGDIIVDAKAAMISNRAFIRSDTVGAGSAGAISLQADAALILQDGAQIAASARRSGVSGRVEVRAAHIVIADSTITTEARLDDGGDIDVAAEQSIVLRNSQISASSQGGENTEAGEITLDSNLVFLQGSSVLANAPDAKGANIEIPRGVFIADLESEVRASGRIFNGGQFFDIGGVVQSPLTFLQLPELQNQRCVERVNRSQASSLALVGREALPLEPGSVLLSDLSMGLAGEGYDGHQPLATGSPIPSSFPIILPHACDR